VLPMAAALFNQRDFRYFAWFSIGDRHFVDTETNYTREQKHTHIHTAYCLLPVNPMHVRQLAVILTTTKSDTI
jgi:hypothetical protein